MHLELTDEQTEALIRELCHTIDGDRYPLSPRIVAVKEILGMMRPEPARPTPLSPATALRTAEQGALSETRLALHPLVAAFQSKLFVSFGPSDLYSLKHSRTFVIHRITSQPACRCTAP
jgi:hypothetical protein